MTVPSGSESTSSAACACSAEEYSTTGGHGEFVSEPPIAQALSQCVTIRRAAGGGVEHLAVDGIVSLLGVKAFGRAPGAFTGAAQVHQEQQDCCNREDQAQRLARRAMGKEPKGHRWPRFQSSSRA